MTIHVQEKNANEMGQLVRILELQNLPMVPSSLHTKIDAIKVTAELLKRLTSKSIKI
jgi:hypothetical protein